jgi:CRP/FNR family cyclic AMP-dependent transcriptional regulator
MNDSEAVALLGEYGLFRGVSDAQVQAVARSLKRVSLPVGAYLVREGEPARELFLIERGAVEILKREPGQAREHVVATAGRGEVIGEIALIGLRARSASVRTVEPSEVLVLPFDGLERREGPATDALDDRGYLRLLLNLSEGLVERIERRTEQAVAQAQTRLAMGHFLLNIMVVLALYTLTLGTMPYLQRLLPNDSAFVSVPLQAAFAVSTLLFMKKSGYPWRSFGLTLEGAGRIAVEGAVFTVPFLAAATAVKWLLIQLVPDLRGTPLLELHALAASAGAGWMLAFGSIYAVFVVIQELVVRAGLQTALELFLVTRRRVLSAILVSNLIFAVAHLHISLAFAAASFVAGLGWGWLFARQRSLVGVIVSHLLTGLFVLFVLGSGVVGGTAGGGR